MGEGCPQGLSEAFVWDRTRYGDRNEQGRESRGRGRGYLVTAQERGGRREEDDR